MSALLTTTMSAMRSTIEVIVEAGFRDGVKIMVGAAPVTQSHANEIWADGYVFDATSAVRKARELLGIM